MKILLASRNPGKAREARAALAGVGVELLDMGEAGLGAQVRETGATYAENALIKAQAGCRASGLPALADDSGMEVEALPRELGVRSARFGGAGLDDRGRNALLLERMRDVPEASRGARYVCVLAYVKPDGWFGFFEGALHGRIWGAPRGAGGFGYDPLMYLPQHGCAVSELPLEVKNRISHRGLAFAQFREWLARDAARVSS